MQWPRMTYLIRCVGSIGAAACLLSACGSSGPQLLDAMPLAADTQPTALMVLPVGLTVPGTTALEVAARTLAVDHYLMQKLELPIISLFDIDVNKRVDDVRTASADTDLFTKSAELGLDVRKAVVLHLLITENRATNQTDIQDLRKKDPKQQKTYRQHGLSSTVRLELTWLDAMRGQRLGGLTLEIADDPTDFVPGGDPRPGVTAGIEYLLDKYLELYGESLQRKGQRRTRGLGLVDHVGTMLSWHAPELPSHQEMQHDKADILKEADALEKWDRFAPGLSARELHDAAGHKGVLVHVAQPPLAAGDIILSAQKQPVAAAYQLDRQLQVCGPSPCILQVFRAGQVIEVPVNWPVLAPGQGAEPPH